MPFSFSRRRALFVALCFVSLSLFFRADFSGAAPVSTRGIAKAKSAPRVLAKPKAAPKAKNPVPRATPYPDAKTLDPNRTPFPQSSLHDFSDLLEAPAGKRGFMTTGGGHFVWRDGTRARFWGINVANSSVQESDKNIDAMINAFRRAGFNLLRLHHFDERLGIINLDAPDSRRFNAARLKKLDYWIYKAKQAGMYVYLDLLDYRRFKAGDGVPNAEAIGRAARPYAVFDPRLIELQKEYAKKLLRDHVNPYTKLAYADEPAVAVVELYDESGLFMRRGVWREMPQPYAARFQKLWNNWLKARYGNTRVLAGAWTDASGATALQKGESLENGTVQVPAMTWDVKLLPQNQRVWAALPRRNDGARFAYDLHKKYFAEMKSYLRGIGVKVPISATGRFEDMADLKSMSEGLDFIGSNFYYDHPYWAAGAPAWQPPSFYRNQNPMHDIDDRSFAASISLARIKDKPFVVREWNYCYPNRNRGTGIIEAASYAAMHDLDAMILFTYETKPTARVDYFNVRSDPTRWGLCGIAAQVFLKGLVQTSRNQIVVPYNDTDVFTYTRYTAPLYSLGWTTRVENTFYNGDVYRADDKQDNQLLVAPGRSGTAQLEGAPAVLHTETLARDTAGHTVFAPNYLSEYSLTATRASRQLLIYDGLLFNSPQQRALSIALPLAPIRALGFRPIGYNESGDVTQGFLDEERRRLVFGSLEPFDVVRASLDALRIFRGVPNTHDATEQAVFTTDTGETLRDAASGRMVVSTPGFQALCGNLVGVGRVLAPGLRVRNARTGTLVAVALDGLPLVKSHRFVIKMVTDARNVDELSGRDPRFLKNPDGQWRIDVLGNGPVTTMGKPSKTPIKIAMEGKPLVDVYLTGGSFELYVDGANKRFYCDTPGIRSVVY